MSRSPDAAGNVPSRKRDRRRSDARRRSLSRLFRPSGTAGSAGVERLEGRTLLSIALTMAIGAKAGPGDQKNPTALVVGLTHSVNPGDTVIVEVTADALTDPGSVSVSDAKNGGYGSADASLTQMNMLPVLFFSKNVTNALNAGDSLTVNFPAGVLSEAASVLDVPGLVVASPVDLPTFATATGLSATNPSVTIDTTNPSASQPNELIVGAIIVGANQPIAPYPPAAPNPIENALATGNGSNVSLLPEYQVATSKGKYTAGGVTTPAAPYTAAAVAYKAVPPLAPRVPGPVTINENTILAVSSTNPLIISVDPNDVNYAGFIQVTGLPTGSALTDSNKKSYSNSEFIAADVAKAGLTFTPPQNQLGTIQADKSGQFTFNVAASTTNDASAVIGPTDAAVVNISPVAQLNVQVSTSGSAESGTSLTFQATVTNLGPNKATGVTIANAFTTGANTPAPVSGFSAVYSVGGGASMTASPTGNANEFNIGDLDPGSQEVVKITVTPSQAVDLKDTVTVRPGSPQVSPTTASASATAAAASMFTVTNPGDTGAGTLHDVILNDVDVRPAGGPAATIKFADNVTTVTLMSDGLPDITRPVVIQGFGPKNNTVTIDARQIPGSKNVFTVDSNDVTLRSLVVMTNAAVNAAVLLNSGTNDQLQGTTIQGLSTTSGVGVGVVNATGSVIAGGSVTGFKTGVQVATGGNVIGGMTAADSVQISGNDIGVLLKGSGATGNKVEGDTIGTDAKGTAASTPAQRIGVLLEDGASGNVIGANNRPTLDQPTSPSPLGNIIAFNFQDGVTNKADTKGDTDGGDNLIEANSIFNNGPLPPPTGSPNHGLNLKTTIAPPTLLGAETVGVKSTAVQFQYTLPPDGHTYRIDFYDSAPVPNAVNPNSNIPYQGKSYFGSMTVSNGGTTPLTVNDTFTAGVSITVNDFVTSTATDVTSQATSDFSPGLKVTQGLTVTTTADNGNDVTPTQGSLRDAIKNANQMGASAITFDINLLRISSPSAGDVYTFKPVAPLPTVTAGNVTIDASNLLLNDGKTVITRPNTQSFGDAAVLSIVIDGSKLASAQDTSSATSGTFGLLTLSGTNDVVKGLILQSFAATTNENVVDAAVLVTGASDTLAGNFIGGGFTPGGSGNGVGVLVNGVQAKNSVIGGVTNLDPSSGKLSNPDRNVISNNKGAGVEFSGGTSANALEGNLIGLSPYLDASHATSPAAKSPNLTGVLVTQSPDNVIGGPAAGAANQIGGNSTFGVEVSDGNSPASPSSGTRVEHNFIGTDGFGDPGLGNGNTGVLFDQVGSAAVPVTNELVGDNVIGGNALYGVHVAQSYGVTLSGNQIGVFTNTALPNGPAGGLDPATNLPTAGVFIDGSVGTLVGGTTDAGNTIAGNHGSGVLIKDATVTAGSNPVINPLANLKATGNSVSGNAIGNVQGGAGVTAAVPNTAFGVDLMSASGNVIGAPVASILPAGLPASPYRNVISGNLSSGVRVEGTGATGNTVDDNLIGLDATGTTAVPNGGTVDNPQGGGIDVVSVFNAPPGTNPPSPPAVLPPTLLIQSNVVSGNTLYGVSLEQSTAGVSIVGNLIGTNAAGIMSVAAGAAQVDNGNATTPGEGIFIDGAQSSAPGPTTGNTVSGNTISGNTGSGVLIIGALATGNSLSKNTIGLDPNGFNVIANQGDGVTVSGVKGPNTIDGNVISGNKVNGVNVAGVSAGANGNATAVTGNVIGLDVSGNILRPNGVGVNVVDSPGTLIGATSTTDLGKSTPAGGNSASKNVISGNSVNGIQVGGNSGGVVILGNRIGTDLSGVFERGNGSPDVPFGEGSVNRNTRLHNDGILIDVNGSVTNGVVLAYNLVSGNTAQGIEVNGSGSTRILGNRIGTDVSGGQAIGNRQDGVLLVNAPNTLVGGSADLTLLGGVVVPAANLPNLISANRGDGLQIVGAGSTGVTVQGNRVGTDGGGQSSLGNLVQGVSVVEQASGDQIDSNDIGGNLNNGVYAEGVSNLTVTRNGIGTDRANGSLNLGNRQSGVFVKDSSNVTIGGADPKSGNVISGNALDGVTATGSGAKDPKTGAVATTTGLTVEGNRIGTDQPGNVAPYGNLGAGVYLAGVGDATVSDNLISGNTLDGVKVIGAIP